MSRLEVILFSDVLCGWAQIGDERVSELGREFGDQVIVRQHFLSVFADARERLAARWEDRGGLGAFREHVVESFGRFEHVALHEDVWAKITPFSSTPSHLFLAATRRCLGADDAADAAERFGSIVRCFRRAFFAEGRDISQREVLVDLAGELELPLADIDARIATGEAYAALAQDRALADRFGASMSPTFVLNEGRQKLAGNVGYRVLQANVRELIERPLVGASWC
jgi:predicted DsbA family dithiol-disulfide isomerase